MCSMAPAVPPVFDGDLAELNNSCQQSPQSSGLRPCATKDPRRCTEDTLKAAGFTPRESRAGGGATGSARSTRHHLGFDQMIPSQPRKPITKPGSRFGGSFTSSPSALLPSSWSRPHRWFEEGRLPLAIRRFLGHHRSFRSLFIVAGARKRKKKKTKQNHTLNNRHVFGRPSSAGMSCSGPAPSPSGDYDSITIRPRPRSLRLEQRHGRSSQRRISMARTVVRSRYTALIPRALFYIAER